MNTSEIIAIQIFVVWVDSLEYVDGEEQVHFYWSLYTGSWPTLNQTG